MATTFENLAGRCCGTVLLSLVLALAACGPGTGGTGTGPIALSYSGTAGVILAPAPGACEFASCDRVDLRLEDTGVELTAGCARFTHAGAWAVDEAGLLLLAGDLESVTAAGTTRVPATLRLQFSNRDLANADVTVLLLGADGRALLGPVTLQRHGGAAPGFQACEPR